jgi:hypothetical protein
LEPGDGARPGELARWRRAPRRAVKFVYIRRRDVERHASLEQLSGSATSTQARGAPAFFCCFS